MRIALVLEAIHFDGIRCSSPSSSYPSLRSQLELDMGKAIYHIYNSELRNALSEYMEDAKKPSEHPNRQERAKMSVE